MGKAFLVLFVLFLFLLKVRGVRAASCDMSAEMDGSMVTLRLSSCTDDGNYLVQILKDGEVVEAMRVIVFGGVGQWVFVPVEAGRYKAQLIFAGNVVSETDFSVNRGDIVPLRCGDSSNSNDLRCPESCPAIHSGGSWSCSGINRTGPRSQDIFCDALDLDNPKVNTALGCIPVKADKFVEWLLPYVFGIAGGIAFLIMVGGFIRMATSKGDPKAVQAAREMIGSAVTGLLVSVFALFILRLIAVDILHIPGMK